MTRRSARHAERVGDVIPLRRRLTRPERPASARSSKLGSLRPEQLGRILRDAERGEIADFVDLADRMVQLDGHIRANYITRLAAVGAARSEWIPGRTGDPERDFYAEQAAQFCADRIGECDSDDRAVMELLDAVGIGLSVQEMDYAWRDEGWWTIDRFRFVHQRRLRFDEDWEPRIVDFGGGRTVSGGVRLSRWSRKFVVHQSREHATDPSCTGVLRSVAWLYLFKRWALQFWVHGAERFAWPMVLGWVKRTGDKAARRNLLEILEEFTAEHRAVLDEGDKVELIESQLKDAGTWRELTNTLNAEIGKALLGSVDQTEPTEIGAWKAVESRKATTVDSRQAMDERQLAATYRRDVITPLLEFNTHLWNGVLPAIPTRRWVIAETRKNVPREALEVGAVTYDELRGSLGLDPWGPDRGGDERVLLGSGSQVPPVEPVSQD